MADILKQPIHLEMDNLLDEYKARKEEMGEKDLTRLRTLMLKAIQELKKGIKKRREKYSVYYDAGYRGITNSRKA